MGVLEYIRKRKEMMKADRSQARAATSLIDKKKKAAYFRALEKEQMKDAELLAKQKVQRQQALRPSSLLKSGFNKIKATPKKGYRVKKARVGKSKKIRNKHLELNSDKAYDPYEVKNVFK